MKVTAGVFRKDDCVLLMRRARTEPLAGEWEYPGGKFEEGEDGPVCLHRELKEELGIDAQIGDLITDGHHCRLHSQLHPEGEGQRAGLFASHT